MGTARAQASREGERPVLRRLDPGVSGEDIHPRPWGGTVFPKRDASGFAGKILAILEEKGEATLGQIADALMIIFPDKKRITVYTHTAGVMTKLTHQGSVDRVGRGLYRYVTRDYTKRAKGKGKGK